MKDQILGIGASCVDIVVKVDELFLFQNCPGKKGLSARVELHEFEKILAKAGGSFLTMPGGIAANTLRALANLGQKCAFLSWRGDDPLGELLAKNWKRLNVLEWAALLPNYPTARALCLISPDGQRTIFGVSKKMNNLAILPGAFKNVALAHIESYLLAHSDFLERVLEEASKENTIVSLSLSCIGAVLEHKETLLRLLERYVDLVFLNEEEARILFGLPPEEGCVKLQEMCGLAIVTQGDKGCLIGHEKGLSHFPAFPADVVDTTGAGDLFASGFIYGYLKGCSISKCAEIGNFLGSVAVTTMGAELPEEKWRKIHAYLEKN